MNLQDLLTTVEDSEIITERFGDNKQSVYLWYYYGNAWMPEERAVIESELREAIPGEKYIPAYTVEELWVMATAHLKKTDKTQFAVHCGTDTLVSALARKIINIKTGSADTHKGNERANEGSGNTTNGSGNTKKD